MKKKHLIISHKNCSDGLCAAHVAKNVLEANGEDVEVIFFDHKEIEFANLKNNERFLKSIEEAYELTLTDIFLSPEVMDFVFSINNGLKVKVIDHHLSAARDYQEFLEGEKYPLLKRKVENGQYKFEFNNNYSGGVLTFVELCLNKKASLYNGEFDNMIPKFLKYVQDRDIWKWEFVEESKPFNEIFFHKCKTLKDMEENFPLRGLNASKTTSYNTSQYIDNGKFVIEHVERQLQEVSKEAEEASVKINGIEYKGYLINTSSIFNSELGNKLSHLNEEHCFSLLWSETGQGIIKCSLRGRDDFDVSVIAKHFNGGGHKAASAFAVDDLESFVPIKKGFQTGKIEIESDLMPKKIKDVKNNIKY